MYRKLSISSFTPVKAATTIYQVSRPILQPVAAISIGVSKIKLGIFDKSAKGRNDKKANP